MSIGAEFALLRDLASVAGRRAARLGDAGELAARVVRDPDGIPHVTGDLERFVLNFVEASPRRDSLLYRPPADAERATLVTGWDVLRRGDAALAAELVAPSGMSVVRFTDTAGGNAVHLGLAELPLDPERLRGLGLFLHRTDAEAGALHVQVPHPWDDIATESLGLRTYRGAIGQTLSIAGASRHAVPGRVSDAAHDRGSLFHALVDRTAEPGARQLQLHGFSEAKHHSYGQAVVSTGARPTPAARRLHGSLVDHGIDARLAGGDRPYVNLAGRNNVQGQDARARPLQERPEWLHVEVGSSMRTQAQARELVVAALLDGTRPARGQPGNFASR